MEQVYLFSFQYVSQDPTGPSWQGKYILPDWYIWHCYWNTCDALILHLLILPLE
jgi:hypothetical protein